MARILILSNGFRELDGLRSVLGAQGHQVALCGLEDASIQRAVEERRPDLLMLHANGSRPEVARVRAAARGSDGEDTGLIVLTTPEGLRLLEPAEGIDDFVVEPFRDAEIAHRVRMVLHRLRKQEGEPMIRIGDLEIDVENYTVTLAGDPIDLTYKEYQLLKFLASHSGRVFTRDSLLTQVWGYDYYGGTRTVDVHIRRIRAKLGTPYDRLVETVHNVGYKFVLPRAPRA